MTPVEPQSGAAGPNAWVASDDGRIAVESIRESLAPGEVLVEPANAPSLAARPGGSFASSGPQSSAPPLTSRGGLSAPPQATAHPAVVRVVAADFGGASLGSGTLVDVNDEHGLVVTNWHVVRDAPGNVIVVFPDGFQSLGRVLRMDANWDLAAILINKPRVAPVRLATQAPQIGESLTIAGYGGGAYRAVAGPCTQYLAPSVQHPQELVELAASARQGDSGGPIFNSRGELAGVLFGEAGGRTTGAYCGRVHSFLAAAVKELYDQNGSQLAESPDGGRSPPASVASLSSGSGSASLRSNTPPQDAIAATSPEYWQNPHIATQADPSPIGQPSGPKPDRGLLAADSSLDTSSTTHTNESLAPASFSGLTPKSANPADSSPSWMGPVASIESPAIRDSAAVAPFKTSTEQTTASESVASVSPSKGDRQSDAAAGASSLTWQVFAGETLIAQIKTVLACVGLLAVLIHGSRAVAHVSGSGEKAPAKRAKK